MYSYPASSFIDLFSLNIELRVCSNIAAALFVIVVVINVPDINIANALHSNVQPANNTNNFASNDIAKQTVSSHEKDNTKDGETATHSPDDSISIHFPIPTDHNNKIKTTNDDGNHEKDNDKGSADKDTNDNKNSKGKDLTTNTTPLHIPFP